MAIEALDIEIRSRADSAVDSVRRLASIMTVLREQMNGVAAALARIQNFGRVGGGAGTAQTAKNVDLLRRKFEQLEERVQRYANLIAGMNRAEAAGNLSPEMAAQREEYHRILLESLQAQQRAQAELAAAQANAPGGAQQPTGTMAAADAIREVGRAAAEIDPERLNAISASLHQFGTVGRYIGRAATGFNQISDALANMGNGWAVIHNLGVSLSGFNIESVGLLGRGLSSLGRGLARIGESAEDFDAEAVNRVVEVVHRLVDEVARLSPEQMTAFAAALRGFSSAAAKLARQDVGKQAQKAAGGFGKLFSMIGRMALYRAIRAAIRAIVNAVKEGVKNLAEWDRATGQMNTSNAISTLSAYNGQLLQMKNAVGAAAMPLLQLLLPAFNAITNAVITAANAIQMFFRALGGYGTYMKANTDAVYDYAQSLSSAGGSASKLKNTLLGFDELNVMNDPSSGGGGGGGSNWGGIAAEDLFSEENISSALSVFTDLANAITNVWDALSPLRSALAKIYQKFKDKAMTHFINGWGDIAEAIQGVADLLNGDANGLVGLLSGVNGALSEGASSLGDTVDFVYDLVSYSNNSLVKAIFGDEKHSVLLDTTSLAAAAMYVHDMAGTGGDLLITLATIQSVMGEINDRADEVNWKKVLFDQEEWNKLMGIVKDGILRMLPESVRTMLDRIKTEGKMELDLMWADIKYGCQMFTAWLLMQGVPALVNGIISAVNGLIGLVEKALNGIIDMIMGNETLKKIFGLAGISLDRITLPVIPKWETPEKDWEEFKTNMKNKLNSERFTIKAQALVDNIIQSPVFKLSTQADTKVLHDAVQGYLDKVHFYLYFMPKLTKTTLGVDVKTGSGIQKHTLTFSQSNAYAEGGFPQPGQLFIANESGPEMVGTMGGRTAVANSDQIVAGITSGVMAAMAGTGAKLDRTNDLLAGIAEKDGTVVVSTSDIAAGMARMNRRAGATVMPVGA